MDLFSSQQILGLLLFLPVFVLSLSIHEWAHAYTADKLGDSTARYLGRMTFDPIAHISVIGTLVFPAVSYLMGAPLFGWANPVPVDARNFKKPRQHMAWVAAAGPFSNIVLAVVSTALLSWVIHSAPFSSVGAEKMGTSGALIQLLVMSVQMNLFLAFFNLLPLPPLDGSRVIRAFVGPALAQKIDEFEGKGMGSFLILALFMFGVLKILAIPVYGMLGFLFKSFGIPM